MKRTKVNKIYMIYTIYILYIYPNKIPYHTPDRISYKVHMNSSYTKDNNNPSYKISVDTPDLPNIKTSKKNDNKTDQQD